MAATRYPLRTWQELANDPDALKLHLLEYLRLEADNGGLLQWAIDHDLEGLRELQCADLVWNSEFAIDPAKWDQIENAPPDVSIAPPLIVVRYEDNPKLSVADGIHRIASYLNRDIQRCWGLILVN